MLTKDSSIPLSYKNRGLKAGVTGQQGMFIPLSDLNPFLVLPMVRVGSALDLVFFMGIARLIPVPYLHLFQRQVQTTLM